MSAIVWLNLGLGAVFFGVLVGASLWLVLKHPDRPPVFRAVPIPAQRPASAALDRRPAHSAHSGQAAGQAAGRRAA